MPVPSRFVHVGLAGLAAALVVVLAPASAQDTAKGDATKGHDVFATNCGICHSDLAAGDGAKLSLFGVAGRKAGGATGYTYSDAMTSSGITWTDDKLDAFITAPATVVPGTEMYFGGLDKADDRANVIAYLKSLK